SGNGRSEDLDGDFLATAGAPRELDGHGRILRLELTQPRVGACESFATRLRSASRAPVLCLSHRSGRLALLRFGRDPALLGFAAGQGNVALVLRLDQVALDLALDVMRQLPIPHSGQADTIAMAEQPLLAREIRTILGVQPRLICECLVNVDELYVVEESPLTHDRVQHPHVL